MALTEFLAFTLLPALLYKYILYPAFFSPLSKIPNAHFTSPFSNGWIHWQRYSGRENRAIHNAHERHGHIVRLGSTEVSVASVEALRVVYSDAFNKHEWYGRAFENYDTPNMFSTVDRRLHKERRRMLVGLYKKTTVQSSPEIHKIAQTILTDRLLPILEGTAKDRHPFDALELSMAIAMDFITAYLFGISSSSNFLQGVRTRQQWLAALRSTKGHEFWALEFASLTSFLSKFGIDLVPTTVISAFDEVKDLCLKMLDKVESSPYDSAKGVSYDQLLRRLTPSYRDEAELRRSIASEHMDNIMAGTETTGWTMTYILHELSQNPDLQVLLRSELHSLTPPFTYHPASSAATELPSFRPLEALPLLDAIIHESLRLHPAVPGPQPRVTPNSPVSLEGYDNIPSGIRVSAQAYTLHRNAKVFPEPEIWKPERWLHASAEEKTEMMRWFWSFGNGSRMCIGSSFALLEMKLIIACIYTNYRTHIVDDEGIEQVDGFTTGPKGNKLILRLERA